MGILQLVFIQIVTFTIILLVLRFVSGTQLKVALKRLQDLHQENLSSTRRRAETPVSAHNASLSRDRLI